MFHAFIIACAATISLQVDESSCIIFTDDWGPYVTEDNCNIRVDQMLANTEEEDMKTYLTYLLGNPDMIYTNGSCYTAPGSDV